MRSAMARPRGSGSLGELDALIDWAEVDRHLAPIYTAAKGERAWPPLPLFKALLLAVWYDLSDVKLAEALDDRALLRRFCGFAAPPAHARAHRLCPFPARVAGARPRPGAVCGRDGSARCARRGGQDRHARGCHADRLSQRQNR